MPAAGISGGHSDSVFLCLVGGKVQKALPLPGPHPPRPLPEAVKELRGTAQDQVVIVRVMEGPGRLKPQQHLEEPLRSQGLGAKWRWV